MFSQNALLILITADVQYTKILIWLNMLGKFLFFIFFLEGLREKGILKSWTFVLSEDFGAT